MDGLWLVFGFRGSREWISEQATCLAGEGIGYQVEQLLAGVIIVLPGDEARGRR